ncbi:MAG TPA: porin [Gemmatimonadaceae bacterium]|nr:porin [Gemmatimonadaceae bacterium]
MLSTPRAYALLVIGLLASRGAAAQRPPRSAADSIRDSVLANGITAGEADGERMNRNLLSRARLNFGFTTFELGGGVLVDYIGYDQDSASRSQFDLASIGKLRDARVLVGGKFSTKRSFTWQAGVMYDAATKKWLVRQSGVMIAIPELWGHLFIGRAKEGFSLNKVMVGYDGWTMERQPFTDASIPLLADGIKWLGYVPSQHWFWNLGVFGDGFSQGQTFSSYSNQFVVRSGWVPVVSDSAGSLVHVAVNYRIGKPLNDSLRLRSRPEAFEAPYFIDTGPFTSTLSQQLGPEVYYRPGRLLFGGEYYWQNANSADKGNLWFNGGEVVATWLTTGETRSYNTVGNYFRSIAPTRTVMQGGPGAWEAVLKYSYANLNSRSVQGGRFSRVTPMLNWYLTDNARLEIAYGFGVLNRFGTIGHTQFFQVRLQTEL